MGTSRYKSPLIFQFLPIWWWLRLLNSMVMKRSDDGGKIFGNRIFGVREREKSRMALGVLLSS